MPSEGIIYDTSNRVGLILPCALVPEQALRGAAAPAGESSMALRCLPISPNIPMRLAQMQGGTAHGALEKAEHQGASHTLGYIFSVL